MTKPSVALHRGPLHAQIEWFIRLRWIAALTVVAGAWIDSRWLGWYGHWREIAAVGVVIAVYNVLLWWVLRAKCWGKRFLRVLACIQLILDMVCLTVLTIWTGGVESPLTPFYVLHMVFASVLLPRALAYGSAALVITMYLSALALNGTIPTAREDRLIIFGRIVALLTTIHLANHITRGLSQQRRRLIRQNRRIRTMSRQLKRHQRAMIQHEKMVALGQMAAGVTHEIANPLASMDSLLQLMQRRPDRMRPDALTTLRGQIERINQIIQQMKTFAHPAEVLEQTVDLNELVDQSLHMIRFDKRLLDVKVERKFSPDTGRISLLPQALQQVLVNLIINALDAMAQTPNPVLKVRTERREGWCVIEVSDNGTGIAHEHMGRLFEPFFTTKPVGKGTGLGLSISYSLVQKQGGSITVQSHLGRGSSFTVRLPIRSKPSRSREEEIGGVVISEKPMP